MMMKGRELSDLRKNDAYLVFIILFVVLVWLIVRHIFFTETGTAITVSQGAYPTKAEEIYPLSKEGEFVFTDPDGGTNTLVVQNGTAYISAANCPDGRCMKQRPVSRKGESIICLPHRMVIEVIQGTDSGIDAIAQ